MPVPVVKRHPLHGFKFYDPCPVFTVRDMPEGSQVVLPMDGGFWVVDQLTGIRYRRLTMADLPKGVTFNTRGKADDGEADGWDSGKVVSIGSKRPAAGPLAATIQREAVQAIGACVAVLK